MLVIFRLSPAMTSKDWVFSLSILLSLQYPPNAVPLLRLPSFSSCMPPRTKTDQQTFARCAASRSLITFIGYWYPTNSKKTKWSHLNKNSIIGVFYTGTGKKGSIQWGGMVTTSFHSILPCPYAWVRLRKKYKKFRIDTRQQTAKIESIFYVPYIHYTGTETSGRQASRHDAAVSSLDKPCLLSERWSGTCCTPHFCESWCKAALVYSFSVLWPTDSQCNTKKTSLSSSSSSSSICKSGSFVAADAASVVCVILFWPSFMYACTILQCIYVQYNNNKRALQAAANNEMRCNRNYRSYELLQSKKQSQLRNLEIRENYQRTVRRLHSESKWVPTSYYSSKRMTQNPFFVIRLSFHSLYFQHLSIPLPISFRPLSRIQRGEGGRGGLSLRRIE